MSAIAPLDHAEEAKSVGTGKQSRDAKRDTWENDLLDQQRGEKWEESSCSVGTEREVQPPLGEVALARVESDIVSVLRLGECPGDDLSVAPSVASTSSRRSVKSRERVADAGAPCESKEVGEESLLSTYLDKFNLLSPHGRPHPVLGERGGNEEWAGLVKAVPGGLEGIALFSLKAQVQGSGEETAQPKREGGEPVKAAAENKKEQKATNTKSQNLDTLASLPFKSFFKGLFKTKEEPNEEESKNGEESSKVSKQVRETTGTAKHEEESLNAGRKASKTSTNRSVASRSSASKGGTKKQKEGSSSSIASYHSFEGDCDAQSTSAKSATSASPSTTSRSSQRGSSVSSGRKNSTTYGAHSNGAVSGGAEKGSASSATNAVVSGKAKGSTKHVVVKKIVGYLKDIQQHEI